jgi:hypothetical protein
MMFSYLRKISREPLVHFLVLGAGLFLLYGVFNRTSEPEPNQIVVTQARIDQLAAGFERVWHRPPTTEELDALVADHVRGEIYCREAIALGLDREDVVIRNRLRLKLEYVSEDIATLTEPTDEQLSACLASHPDEFRSEARLSFVQVFLSKERRRDTLAADAATLITQLNQAGADADVTALGDPTLLATKFSSIAVGQVETVFGQKFMTALRGLKRGTWHGPIESAYGAHLVLITEQTEGQIPPLAEIRPAVRRDWLEQRRRSTIDQYYAKLLHRYSVVIERRSPQTAARDEVVAAAQQVTSP